MVAPDRVAFSIFGVDIMWYGLLIGIGFMLSGLIANSRAAKHEIKKDFILDLLIWLIPAAIVGARAYYVIFSWDMYKNDPMQILNIRSGGLAIHGGLLLCFLTAYFVCRFQKQGYIQTMDLCASVIPLGQAIGRWGNFFNEEAHGIQTDLPWAQIIDGVGYHPTFLYESIWCFGMFLFLLWFDNHKRSFDGQIISLYLILYGIERFFVEGLRTDSLWLIPGKLRQAQVISLGFILVGLIIYVFFKKYSAEFKAKRIAKAEGAMIMSAVGTAEEEAEVTQETAVAEDAAGMSEADSTEESENAVSETAAPEEPAETEE